MHSLILSNMTGLAFQSLLINKSPCQPRASKCPEGSQSGWVLAPLVLVAGHMYVGLWWLQAGASWWITALARWPKKPQHRLATCSAPAAWLKCCQSTGTVSTGLLEGLQLPTSSEVRSLNSHACRRHSTQVEHSHRSFCRFLQKGAVHTLGQTCCLRFLQLAAMQNWDACNAFYCRTGHAVDNC